LRTIAGVGDMGRDAVFEAVDGGSVVLQYSIDEDWRSKIKGAVRRRAEADTRLPSGSRTS
jgi:hypothetical protein